MSRDESHSVKRWGCHSEGPCGWHADGGRGSSVGGKETETLIIK